MKKVLSVLIVCMLLTGLCVSAVADATPITFWTFQAAHQTFMEKAEARWNEAYPDRQIDLQAETLGYDDLHNNLMISLLSAFFVIVVLLGEALTEFLGLPRFLTRKAGQAR